MPALPFIPVLDREYLRGAETDSWDVQNPQIKKVRETATGARREAFAYAGLGKELIVTKLQVTFQWSSIGSLLATVEELLAVPGPHQLILWRPETKAFIGDGARREFFSPWLVALEGVDTPPSATPGIFDPKVKIARTGAVLDYVAKSEGDYAAGEPESDEVWWTNGGTAFKLGVAPAEGEIVYLSIIPVFEVFSGAENSKKFSDAMREPRSVTLLER